MPKPDNHTTMMNLARCSAITTNTSLLCRDIAPHGKQCAGQRHSYHVVAHLNPATQVFWRERSTCSDTPLSCCDPPSSLHTTHAVKSLRVYCLMQFHDGGSLCSSTTFMPEETTYVVSFRCGTYGQSDKGATETAKNLLFIRR